MNVRDLIEKLQVCNQHSVVKVCSENGGYCYPLLDKLAHFDGNVSVPDDGDDEVLLPSSVILLFEK